MIVVVGSRNPVKVRGVEKAFRAVFGDVEVRGVGVDSGVGPQPVGWEQTLRGARNRALAACREVLEAMFCVGIEAGIVEIGGTWFDTQIAYVVDRNGVEGIGISPTFPLPRRFVEKILSEGVELEQLVDSWFGTHGIGEKGGFVSILTKGLVNREDLVYLATLLALAPWIHRDLYA